MAAHRFRDDRALRARRFARLTSPYRRRVNDPTRERADEYEAYNYDVGIKPLIEKALGVQTFREDRETESEFMTISYWEDVAAMSRFAGDDPKQIHHLARDPEFLVELPDGVQVLQIRSSLGDTGGA